MKAPSPAFSFYPKDILSDEACAAMTDEELGIYVRFLCHAWLEGSIPADVGRLARMARRPRPAFQQLWAAIRPCWKESQDEAGRLIQGRLEHERTKQLAFSAKQSAAARAGGRKRVSRAGSRKQVSHGSATAQPEASQKAAKTSLPSPFPPPTPSGAGAPVSPGAGAPLNSQQSSQPANPLIAGRRPDVERDGYRLIREIATLEPDRDPTEILLEAAKWETKDGSFRSKVRLETMTDDHLIRTVHDLRSILDDAKEKHGKTAPENGTAQRQT